MAVGGGPLTTKCLRHDKDCLAGRQGAKTNGTHKATQWEGRWIEAASSLLKPARVLSAQLFVGGFHQAGFFKGGVQAVERDRFGEVMVHAGRKNGFAMLLKCMGRERYDRRGRHIMADRKSVVEGKGGGL